MGRSDSDLRTISILKGDSKGKMMVMRVILCSVLFAVVISAAGKEEEKSLSEQNTVERVIRAAAQGLRARKRLSNRRRKKAGGRKRSRKLRGERKNLKGRRGEKRRRKNNGAGVDSRRSSSGLNETCFTQAIFFMKLWKDTVANHKKQKSRM